MILIVWVFVVSTASMSDFIVTEMITGRAAVCSIDQVIIPIIVTLILALPMAFFSAKYRPEMSFIITSMLSSVFELKRR